jgi:glycosyltransferase involved in cell wall biosynthesis
MIKVGIAIVTYKRPKELQRCLESIFSYPTHKAEVVIFDDCSLDDTASVARKYGKVISPALNTGVVGNKNRAIYYFTEISKKDVIVLLEDDIYVRSDNWLEQWALAAIKYGHMNFSAPWFMQKTQQNYVTGDGSLDFPHVFKVVTGQCTSFLTEKIKKDVGYLNPLFKGFGCAHVEWTNRFINKKFGGYMEDGKAYYYAIPGDVVAPPTLSFKNDEELNSNKEIHKILRSKNGNYFVEFPWLDENSKTDFLKAYA